MQHRSESVGGPLILLTDPKSSKDDQLLTDWLNTHEVVSYRAADAMDAVGLISDFSMAYFPDLITIPRSDKDDDASMLSLIRSLAGSRFDRSVFYYSEDSAGRRQRMSIEEIEEWFSLRTDQPGI